MPSWPLFCMRETEGRGNTNGSFRTWLDKLSKLYYNMGTRHPLPKGGGKQGKNKAKKKQGEAKKQTEIVTT